MKKQYQSKQWIAFREEIVELDGGICVRCGKSRDAGAILQVHHKRYIKDKPLWEYPVSLCETLCKGCHAAEHGIIPPQNGWDFIGQEDLEGLDGICERCGTEIRHIFFIQHPNWGAMSVGTICCDDLMGTKFASEQRKQADRLKRFINSKRWQKKDDFYTIKQSKVDVKIYELPDGFFIQMNEIKGKKLYESIDDAKQKVFDFITSGEVNKFFEKK